jgi:hypothetical protein
VAVLAHLGDEDAGAAALGFFELRPSFSRTVVDDARLAGFAE